MSPVLRHGIADRTFCLPPSTVGANSLPAVKELVEKSDLVLSVGGLGSDFNTGSFSYELETGNIVEMHSDHTKIGFATFPSLSFRELLPCVSAPPRLDYPRLQASMLTSPPCSLRISPGS
jgi:TPP-dependent 2-oxoacid decarboxylase